MRLPYRHIKKGVIIIGAKVNRIGMMAGIYEILEEVEGKRAHGGSVVYKMRCTICGKIIENIYDNVRNSKVCLHICRTGHGSTKHGTWKNKRIRTIFSGMVGRCYSVKSTYYYRYGARGIKICEEWLANPSLFESWALENGYADDLTIDRINNNGNYEPENCRWVTAKTNIWNSSNAHIIDVDGESKPFTQWAYDCNISMSTFCNIFNKYGEDITKEFIRRRTKDKDREFDRSHPNFVEMYGLIPYERTCPHPKAYKPVAAIKDGIEVAYKNAVEAGNAVGYSSDTIRYHIRNGNPDKNGFTWKYIDKA